MTRWKGLYKPFQRVEKLEGASCFLAWNSASTRSYDQPSASLIDSFGSAGADS